MGQPAIYQKKSLCRDMCRAADRLRAELCRVDCARTEGREDKAREKESVGSSGLVGRVMQERKLSRRGNLGPHGLGNAGDCQGENPSPPTARHWARQQLDRPARARGGERDQVSPMAQIVGKAQSEAVRPRAIHRSRVSLRYDVVRREWN